jgi:hypothetical protein
VMCSSVCSSSDDCHKTLCCTDVPQCSNDCNNGVDQYGVACYSCSGGYTPTYESWTGDAWQSSYSKNNSSDTGSGKAMFWGVGAALCALVAAAALFMTRVSLSLRTNKIGQ